MSLNQLGLGFVFTAKDLATGVMGRVKSAFIEMEDRTTSATKAFESNFAQFGRGIAILGVGLAVLGGAFALSETAGKFEQAIAGVAAVSGASAEELKQLHDAAIQAGIATQYSPIQATVGLRELAQAGYNAHESIQLLIPVLDLAAGSLGELTPQSAAGLAAQTMKAFGLEADQASLAVDQMLQAVNVFALGAGELPLALGIASRGAQTLHQSLSETLVTLGLVKNIIPTVERASTAAAVAMERLANPKVQQQLAGIGVAVTDAKGRFRPFLDIVGSMTPALQRMNEAQRAAYLLHVFGHEALAGVNAIMTQVTHGVRTNTGETLKGAAAIAYLRKQFEEAGGTAAMFRDKLLDTLEGQKQLLHGSLETLSILIGEGFVKTFKPLVAGVTAAINAVIGVVQGMPEPIKTAFARATLVVGALLTVFGGFVAAKAAIALLGAALSAIGVTLGGILSAMLPVAAVFGVLSLVVAGFAVAFQRDIGGIDSFFQRTWAQISLLFRGLGQLVQDGGFSGAVMDELNRAENAGVKQFAIRVFQTVYRIQRFFGGIADGFAAAIERARPVFDAFVDALRELGAAFGIAGAAGVAALAGLHSDKFAQAGVGLGDTLGMIVSILVQVFTAVAHTVSAVVGGVQVAYHAMQPFFDFAGQAVSFLGHEITQLIAAFSGVDAAGQENISIWNLLGEVVGFLAGILGGLLAGAVGVVALALREVVALVRFAVSAFDALGEAVGTALGWLWVNLTERWPKAVQSFASSIKAFFQPVVDFISGIVDAIQAAIERALGYVGKLAAKVPARFRPAFVEDLVDATAGSATVSPASASASAFGRPLPTEPTFPAAAVVEAQSLISEQQADALMSRAPVPGGERPIQANVVLNVDGETIARASAVANRSSRARSFLPVSDATD